MEPLHYNGQMLMDNYDGRSKDAEKEYSLYSHKNSSDNFIKTVSSRMPENNLIMRDIPFGVHFSPFHYLEGELPVFSFGNQDLPRCKNIQCGGYLNPFVSWMYNGSMWKCNLCGCENQTEEHYQNLKDKLNMGSYEFIANASYCDRPVMPPALVFILDVSSNSIKKGFFLSITETIKYILNNGLFPNPDRTKVAFITYDSHVNFFKFDVKFKKNQPQMYCISEQDIFLPCPLETLLISYDEEKDQLIKFLDYLQSIYSVDKLNEHGSHFSVDSNRMLNAIEAGRLILEKNGGKIILANSSFSWVYSSKEAYEMIDKYTNTATPDYIYSLFNPGKYLTEIGRKLTSNLISLDILHLDNTKTYKAELIRKCFKSKFNLYHVLHLNEICNNCNGDLYYFNEYNIDLDYKMLFNTFKRIVTKFTGAEALCKVRMSRDYQIKEIYTPVLTKNLDLFVFPQVDSDQTFSFTIEKKEVKLNGITKINTTSTNQDNNYTPSEENTFCLQFASLYSHYDGTKRIRIQNYKIPKCSDTGEYVMKMDFDAVSALLTKISVNNIFNVKNMVQTLVTLDVRHFKPFNDWLLSLVKKNKGLAHLLNYYDYHLGMLKNIIFCPDEIKYGVNIEFVNFIRTKILKLNTYEISCFLLPKIYDLCPLLEDDNNSFLTQDENNQLILPNLIANSTKYLVKDGLYLIDNGYMLILFSTLSTPKNEEFTQLLLGTGDNSHINSLPEDSVLYSEYRSNKEKILKEKIISLVEYIRSIRTIYQNLQFSLEGKLDNKIGEVFIEDDYCPWYKQDLVKFTKNNS